MTQPDSRNIAEHAQRLGLPDLLAEHDWNTYRCQCHKHTCDGRATHIVEVHALHRCNDPDLNPFGNRVEVLCERCLDMLRGVIAIKLARLRHQLPGRFACETCGAPVAQVSDVLRGVSPL